MSAGPYEVLGVSSNCSQSEIKTAYHKLTRQYHPDKNPGHEDLFKEITAAYHLIGTHESRSEYDSKHSFSNKYRRFEETFNTKNVGRNVRGARRRDPVNGHDCEVEMEFSYKELKAGVDKMIQYKITGVCPYCNGTGAKHRKKCPHCLKEGLSHDCDICEGTGVVTDVHCPHCAGVRLLEINRTCKITVGLDDIGSVKEYIGFGHGGVNGGASGNLHLAVKCAGTKDIDFSEKDCHYIIEVTFPELVLGKTFKMSPLGKEVDIVVPQNTHPRSVLCFSGCGCGGGDLYVHFRLVMPTLQWPEEKKLYEKLLEMSAAYPSLKPKL